MINVYKKLCDDKKINQMYKILIQNLFITYPEFLNNKSKYENEEKYNKWSNMIKTTENYSVITYEQNNRIIGFLSYIFNDSKLWISEVQIKDEYKNKGILKKLLNQFVEINSYYDDITIHINKDNNLSKTVFKHIGFKDIGNTLYNIKMNDLLRYCEKV